MSYFLPKSFLTLLLSVLIAAVSAQTASVRGKVISGGKPVESASIKLSNSSGGTVTDTSGFFSIKNLVAGRYIIHISCVGYVHETRPLSFKEGENKELNVE